MIEYLQYKLAQLIVFFLPLRFVYHIAAGVASVGYCFSRGARRILKENLRNIPGDWTEKTLSECARRNFIQFCKFVADFFYMARLDRRSINRIVTVENGEYVEEAFARGKGVIALTAHIGNWELGGAALALHGWPVSAVALSHEQDKVDAIFVGQRENKGVKVIPLGKAGRIMRALIRGEIVAMLGDRDIASQGGVEMPFFGKPAAFPRGLAALAVRTGAAILPGFVIRQGDNLHKLFFEKPFFADSSGNDSERETELLREWIRILEKYVALYPDQWFMYHRVWDEQQMQKDQ